MWEVHNGLGVRVGERENGTCEREEEKESDKEGRGERKRGVASRRSRIPCASAIVVNTIR